MLVGLDTQLGKDIAAVGARRCRPVAREFILEGCVLAVITDDQQHYELYRVNASAKEVNGAYVVCAQSGPRKDHVIIVLSANPRNYVLYALAPTKWKMRQLWSAALSGDVPPWRRLYTD